MPVLVIDHIEQSSEIKADIIKAECDRFVAVCGTVIPISLRFDPTFGEEWCTF
jgi:hypothetical protein